MYYTLRALLTSGEVELDKRDGLEFGPCLVTQSVAQKLTLTNLSALPQKFGFVELSPELEVQPSDGFGVLLPFQSKVVDVMFKPRSSIAYHLTLTMKTTMGGVYRIPITGQGLEPPLVISQSVMELVPAAVGDRVTASVLVQNPSKTKTQSFEWAVPYPKLSQLNVAPRVASLRPGASTRVEFEFLPKPDKTMGGDDEGEAAAAAAAEAERKAAEEAAAAAEAEPKKGGKGKGKDKGKGKKPSKADEEAAAAAAAAAAAEAEAKAAAEAEAEAAETPSPDELPEHVGKVMYSTAVGAEGGVGEELVAGSQGRMVAPLNDQKEPWSRHASWRVPCFVRGGGGRGGGGARTPPTGRPGSFVRPQPPFAHTNTTPRPPNSTHTPTPGTRGRCVRRGWWGDELASNVCRSEHGDRRTCHRLR